MTLFDKLKGIGSDVVEGTKKFAATQVAAGEKNKEIIDKKKAVLLKLSLAELKQLATLAKISESIEYVTEFNPEKLETKRRKVKADRNDYIEKISDKVKSKDLIYYLKVMKNTTLANELEQGVNLAEETFEQKKKEISTGKEASEIETDRVLNTYLDIIVKSIRVHNPSKEYAQEKLYQTELLGWLKGDLKHQFGKEKVDIAVEYTTPFGKRLDLYVQVGAYRIGIEVKYDLVSSGQVQRFLGQVDEYSEFVDALVLAQYKPIKDGEVLRNIRKKKEAAPIKLRLIASGIEV